MIEVFKIVHDFYQSEEEEEEEENLFAKRLVARKGFSPSTLATIRTTKIDQIYVNTNITCRNN